MGGSVASPAPRDWEEEAGLVGDEGLLKFGREHEVSVALLDGCEGGEDAASYAEVDLAEVGAFFGSGE